MTHVLTTTSQLSQLLRSARRSQQLSQLEAASRLGLSQSRLSEIELDASSVTATQLLTLLALYRIEIVLQDKGTAPTPESEW